MAYIWHLCELNSQVSSNSMVMNDVCQTALYVARDDGYSNVVHAIENRYENFLVSCNDSISLLVMHLKEEEDNDFKIFE
ncbi:putative E3 ubiquitin-protein ligase XBAT34 [Helianthus annuus]|uniref:putative E3 ubiquitin-protein ligase XBAT34 n=1 Tax=Helianthus annuus TaxID=4232 RepID=UPI001653038F|nr:putative E3 ubiquitin-protein ligase XBAT34 [Helianthus annuus]XP_035833849.1 putative E3 ubiquitin-protein ligase XBAT34 [Helianthus annuus]